MVELAILLRTRPMRVCVALEAGPCCASGIATVSATRLRSTAILSTRSSVTTQLLLLPIDSCSRTVTKPAILRVWALSSLQERFALSASAHSRNFAVTNKRSWSNILWAPLVALLPMECHVVRLLLPLDNDVLDLPLNPLIGSAWILGLKPIPVLDDWFHTLGAMAEQPDEPLADAWHDLRCRSGLERVVDLLPLAVLGLQ